MLTGEMSRHTTFRFCLDPTVEQREVLARHAGAARFAFNQCLRMVKTALSERRTNLSVEVPWTGFDLINGFNTWKRTEAAGLCPACGAIRSDLNLADRVFTCGCGRSADRDCNAAVNLARWGQMHHLDPRTPKQRGRATNACRRDGSDQHSRVPVKPTRKTREPTFTPHQRPEPTTPEKGGAGYSAVARHALELRREPS
jgi:hypothetical protein